MESPKSIMNFHIGRVDELITNIIIRPYRKQDFFTSKVTGDSLESFLGVQLV